MADTNAGKPLHIAMYPFFAMGHLTSFLHISNKLAERGNRVSFILPTKVQSKLEHFNHYPDLIRFCPLAVPHVQGLPEGAETTADVPFPSYPLIMTAMDLTKPEIENILRGNSPDFIFFDFAHWVPTIASPLGIKTIHYCTTSVAGIAYLLAPARQLDHVQVTQADLLEPPKGFPHPAIKLHVHEARGSAIFKNKNFGGDMSFDKRQMYSLYDCDAIAFRTCREFEGVYCDYLETEFKKAVLLSGPVIPEPPTSVLEEKWSEWLGKFKEGSVIYCAFGSEWTLRKDQFQELLLGFESTGLPFMAALKPPMGTKTIEEALPEGFMERVQGRGVVHGGWVQQQLLLGHPSIGCFVTHCGSGSVFEALVNPCQLVFLPNAGDQVINARMMTCDLKVGVEIEKGEEDGVFSSESVCKAVKLVMDEDSEVGRGVRENHGKLRAVLLSEGLESAYLDGFVEKLKGMLR